MNFVHIAFVSYSLNIIKLFKAYYFFILYTLNFTVVFLSLFNKNRNKKNQRKQVKLKTYLKHKKRKQVNMRA